MAQWKWELRPVMTRIPEGLRRRLEKAAANSGRSMNSEMIYRLQQSFEVQDLDARLREQNLDMAAMVMRHGLQQRAQRGEIPQSEVPTFEEIRRQLAEQQPTTTVQHFDLPKQKQRGQS
jgi:Arc-like DNA binding dprotein